MSRAVLEAAPAPRGLSGSRGRLDDADVAESLASLLGARVEGLMRSGAGEVDDRGVDIRTQWRVLRVDGRITSVGVSLWGHSEADGADRAEVRRIVEAMLDLADRAGWRVASNVGPVTRAHLDDVLDAI